MSARRTWQEGGPSCRPALSSPAHPRSSPKPAGPQRTSSVRRVDNRDRRGRKDTRTKRDRKGYRSTATVARREQTAASGDKRRRRGPSGTSGAFRLTSGIPQVKAPSTCKSRAMPSVFDFEEPGLGDSRSPMPRNSSAPPTAAPQLDGSAPESGACSTLKTFGRGACSLHVLVMSLEYVSEAFRSRATIHSSPA